MTSVGRFALESETESNPSYIVFFLALSGAKPLRAQEMVQLWNDSGISQRHPRLDKSVVERGYFQPSPYSVWTRITDSLFPVQYRTDIMGRVGQLLTQPLDLTKSLWEMQIASGGTIGSSGAMSQHQARHSSQQPVESVLFFRAHHSMGDGMSLGAVLSELCDEAMEFRNLISKEYYRRKDKLLKLKWWQKLMLFLQRLVWLTYGSLESVLYAIYLQLSMPNNPFDVVKRLSSNLVNQPSSMPRTVSWCTAAPLDEVKQVAKAFGKRVTINDVWAACITHAVGKQLEYHRKRLALVGKDLPKYSKVNVVIPVHMTGGVLLPKQSLGNNLGALCVQLPVKGDESGLQQIHKSLSWAKRTPTAFLVHLTAKLGSILPPSLTKAAFAKANANACVSITNVRQPPHKVHMGGNGQYTVENMAGFIPLPPGLPIGVVVQSYAGNLSLTLTAEPYAVPDPDQFLVWVLEEYQRLLKLSSTKLA